VVVDDLREEIKGIRVRYSAVVNYVSMLFRFISAFLFSLIVIRKLSVDEYGLFTISIAVIYLITPISQIWNFWVYRYYARKQYELSNAGLTITLISILVLTPLTYISTYIVFRNHLYPLIISISLMSILMGNYNITVLSSTKPFCVGYIQFISEIVRVTSAYIYVHVFKMGLTGALLSFLTYALSLPLSSMILIGMYKLYKPRFTLRVKSLIALFKNFYISMLNVIDTQLRASSERLLTFLYTGSSLIPAYIGVSYVARGFIGASASATYISVSARLLRGESRIDIEDTIRLFLVLNLPLAGLFIVFSKLVLSVLNPEYMPMRLLLILYSVLFLLDSYRVQLYNMLVALDKSDIEEHGLALKKSLLYRNTIVLALSTIIYIASGVSTSLIVYSYFTDNPLTVLLPYPLSGIIVYSATILIYHRRLKKIVDYRYPYRELYAGLTGLILMTIYAFTTGFIEYACTSIYREIPVIFFIGLSSIAVYAIVVYTLSPFTRIMLRKGLNEIVKLINNVI